MMELSKPTCRSPERPHFQWVFHSAGAIGEGTFTGSPIEFLGDLALFKATGTSL